MPLFFVYAYLRLYISCFGVALEYVGKIYYNGMDFIAIFAPIFVDNCAVSCAVRGICKSVI